MNHLHEVEDNQEEIEDDQDQTLSTQGDSPPRRAQPETPQSVRRPLGPPGPRDFVSPRAPQGIVTIKPANLFASIQNLKKCKAHTEVFTFSAFTGQPRGNNPTHIKLWEASLAMAKRVFYPPEAER